MGEEVQKKSRRSRRKSKKKEIQPLPDVRLSALAPTISDKARDEFREILTDLMFGVQELSLVLATIKCDKKDKCKLCEKASEIAEKTLQMLKLQRELSQSVTSG